MNYTCDCKLERGPRASIVRDAHRDQGSGSGHDIKTSLNLGSSFVKYRKKKKKKRPVSLGLSCSCIYRFFVLHFASISH